MPTASEESCAAEDDECGRRPHENGEGAAHPLGAGQLRIRATPGCVSPRRTGGERELEERKAEKPDGGEDSCGAARMLARSEVSDTVLPACDRRVCGRRIATSFDSVPTMTSLRTEEHRGSRASRRPRVPRWPGLLRRGLAGAVSLGVYRSRSTNASIASPSRAPPARDLPRPARSSLRPRSRGRSGGTRRTPRRTGTRELPSAAAGGSRRRSIRLRCEATSRGGRGRG
jgi:hypothetical protein